MNTKLLCLVLLASPGACRTAAPLPPAAPPSVPVPSASAAPAWSRLTSTLPGAWTAELGGQRVDVTYRLTSRGSVLLETWMPDRASETVTAYHLDGDTLMLTHYCGQGNQPRLRLGKVDAQRLSFSRFDATNLDPANGVLTELTLALALDGTELVRTETYAQGDARETTTLVFTRREGPGDGGSDGRDEPQPTR